MLRRLLGVFQGAFLGAFRDASASVAAIEATLTDMVDYYNLLGVSPDATPARIKQAFRNRAKGAHPDAHPHLPPAEQEALKRKFILLAQAYETLSDTAHRERYDAERRAERMRRAGAGPQMHAHGARPGAEAGWRTSHSTFRGGRRARGGEAQGADSGPERMDELLRDVERLLGRFGVSLRQPFDELLEALLQWAKTVFRQALEAWEDAGAAPQSPAGNDGSRSRDSPDDPTAGQRSARAGDRTARGSRPSGARGGDAAAVEAELRRLKQRVRERGTRPGGGEPPLEAELRRLKDKLRRRGR